MWGKCTTSAECKSIRIAESSVMDGWKGHRSRRMGNFMFSKEKNGFAVENKEASRRYLGGTEMGEDGWSRGDNQSDLMERKKGVSPS